MNLNKRLGNPAVRAAASTWLEQHGVDLLITQEAWKPVDRPAVELAGFRAVGGDGNLHAWMAERWGKPSQSRPEAFVQRIELDWMLIFNTYLSAYSPAERGLQLTRLNELLASEKGRPSLVCGDFNLAPRPCDGLTAGRTSTFNNATDRAPFRTLLTEHRFVDTTAGSEFSYTVERTVRDQLVQFRCDLALAPDHLAPELYVAVDHTPRSGNAFTDHSAVILDLPVSVRPAAAEEADTLFAFLPQPIVPEPVSEYQPHKTAMSRRAESRYARTVVEVLCPRFGLKSVLDHGCGRGSDVSFYRGVGLDADGWDPHPGFGTTAQPDRQYDLVTSIFVLNVLPDPWQRIQALQHAARFIKPDGYLLAVARSPAEIDTRAAAANWPVHHDGYWSSAAKGTFQKGVSVEEIIALARRAGLVPADEQSLLSPSPHSAQALLRKPG
ncbi:methyltransferase domain-containing protein [Micromonospora noduli]|uniref:methyltransferase domain-containing protein n=1 Tax=Micromonospora noduli TaxID=709876 RepID=UPI00124B080A|nr:methyltransferase domain-containing protein [Micromonospora noduli]KAB1925827.1 methyltransferase domain-containing protein [Micromonospora noduli]